MNRTNLRRQAWLLGVGASLAAVVSPSDAAAPSSAPQVLLAITNSESMDGTTAGAIMVGSGSLGSNFSSLSTSSSPTSFAVPSDFTPPLNAGSGGFAPWTVSCNSGHQCDNGPSRMNMTKSAITQVLGTYGSLLNFGLYTYSTSSVSLYNTWVYYMSPSSGPFGLTNTSSASTLPNPCYQYTSASTSVKSSCSQVAGQYASGALNSNAYLTIGDTSDAPLINDVLYAGSGLPADFLTYGTVSPANPYTYYSLSTYNTNIGGYAEKYSATSYGGSWSTTPTNAGYVPFSPQVLYSQRGFGYGGSQSATTGSPLVAMSTDPTSTLFTNALKPESNDTSSTEIKSSAGQSAIYALMNGAKNYLTGLPKDTCQSQFVVMLTDGLPTLDHLGHAWPPIGTSTGNAYSLTATYNADGSFASSTSLAATDAISAITALKTAGIKTFVIGLGAGVDPTNNPEASKLLKAMAIAGGTTNFYPANSSSSLTAAFSSIVDIIYRTSAVAAPVAPISVAGGTSFEYQMTSIASPASGHVQAFPVAASGVASATPSWDAGDATHMSTTTRTTALKAANATGTLVSLGSVDAAAFSLTTTTCVPDVATIVAYTINPSYSGGPSGCSYLGQRQSGWPLGVFSTQNTGTYMGPPSSGLLTGLYGSYAGFARGQATRTPSLLFTNSDGFLYSVNATSGVLQWGWTSRSILAKLQNYSTFSTSGAADGYFSVVDAMNGSGTWGTYVVGSLQSGAEHFSLALDSSGTPSSLVYDSTIASGTSAGDLAGAAGSTPLRQPTTVAYIGNSAYVIYVVTVGSVSTLYERDVTSSAAPLSAVLPAGFKVSSLLWLNPTSNQLWLGGTDGTVRFMRLTGAPSTDVSTLTTIGTTVNPSSGLAQPVLYVGYIRLNSIPYVYALNSSQLTVFGIGNSGWTPLWASTPTQGYSYASGSYGASATVTKLTTSSVVSDIPIQIGAGLLVPVFAPGSACSAGSGYYDFFKLQDGTFPVTNLTINNVPVTTDLYIGLGPAFTPSVTGVEGGNAYIPATRGGNDTGGGGGASPQTPLFAPGASNVHPIGWTQLH
jgi:type IV pilus assembly protein PilY1